MNTEITIHPTLQHCGLTTANLDAMLEWYREVLGLFVHNRVKAPAGSPFKTVAFATNDEVNHRLSFFEAPDVSIDNDRNRHARVQHIAFEYESLDDLLGTYVRLKKLGMEPLWAADQFFQTAIYYEDPDGNIIELNTNNFANDWTVTEQLRALPAQVHINVDPEKMVAARKAGTSAWEVHERAVAGEFTPATSYELHTTRW
ncbi:MAG TPA: VOC family protein [Verrucomicrobiae bacterium]|jgi:catechol 2,3-dioxygenase|nr:VOC family protein [Verrucomicrobiae bacterium]